MSTVIDVIGQRLLALLEPLEGALESPEALSAFLRRFGWTSAMSEAERAGFESDFPLVGAISAIRDARDRARHSAGQIDVQDVLGVLESGVGGLADLGTAPRGPVSPFDRDEFWQQLSSELLDVLFVEHLAHDYPLLMDALVLLELVRFERMMPSGDQRGPYSRVGILWDALVPALVDPVTRFNERYRDDQGLDHQALLGNLQSIAFAHGIPAELRLPAADHALAFYSEQDLEAHAIRELRIPVAPVILATEGFLELSVTLLPAPAVSGGPPEGISIIPRLSAGDRAALSLGSDLLLEFEGALGADGGHLTWLPDGIEGDPSGTGSFEGRVRLAYIPDDPTVLFGREDGTHLKVAAAEVSGSILLDTNGDPELVLLAGATSPDGPGVSGKLDLAEANSFLRLLVGDEPIEFESDLALSWSSKHGLGLNGRAQIEVVRSLGSSLPFGELTALRVAMLVDESGFRALIGIDANARLGPLAVSVQRIGLEFQLQPSEQAGLFGHVQPDVTFLPPTGAGLSLEVGPIEGGGFVSYSPETGRYVGALELQIGTLGLSAFGIIDTVMPDGSDGFSMLVLVTGRFTPIPIGFGFTLNALGGLLGIHRDVDVDALFGAIRAGTARDLLAPEDPVRDAPRLARQAGAVFPVTRGQHVFGPTLQLGWGSPKQVITLDLGLAVTLPDPLRFILIGTVRAVLPDDALAVARLNVDIAGVLDLSASRFDLEGRIYDSVIQALPITGGFAMRSSWGRDRSFAFSIGGVHPGFTPPANFPTLDRMGVDLSRGSSFQFRLGGYFAITSNSLQLGARADLKVRAAGFTLLADIGFDALFIFDPFGMDLRIYAGASIKRGSTTLLSLRIKGRLRGPGPWHVSGSASFSILFLEVSIGFSKKFGADPDELAEAVDGAALIAKALQSPRSWVTDGASHAGDIVLDDLGEALGPYSPLAVAQKIAPLELTLDQLGGRRLAGARRFEILRLELPTGDLTPQVPVMGAFAPAQFTEMSEQERLSAPSFEDLPAGASFAGDDVIDAGDVLTADTSMEQIILDAPPPSRFPAARPRRDMDVDLAPLAVSRTPTAQIPTGQYAVRSEAWVATDGALAASGAAGTHAQLRQNTDGAVLARDAEVAA